MKVLLSLALCLISVSARADVAELVVYAYDSFVAPGGVGSEVLPLFEKQCGCHVRVLPSGDGAQVLNRLQIDSERGKSVADVVIGLDQLLWPRAKPFVEIGAWTPRGYADLVLETKLGDGFVPMDYGVFAFILDRHWEFAAGFEVPHSLQDLLRPAWRRNMILEDPRTSTPGLAFLLYTKAVAGMDFWRALRSQWLTLAPGWDSAYGLFLRGEAPLVWSYVTSQAYHEENGDHVGRYRAVIFDEGQPIQVEGAAVVRGTRHRELARQFLEFLISPQAQVLFPTRNWMYPVLKSTPLPPSFEHLPKVSKIIRFDAETVAHTLDDWESTVMSSGVLR